MNEVLTKRVYELQEGDIFTIWTIRRIVTYVDRGRIYFNYIDISRHTEESFGAFNKMKVEYNGKKETR